jgi:hypothetical protein
MPAKNWKRNRAKNCKQRKLINKSALASKHQCTDTYVRLVLKGKRDHNSELATSIVEDAKKMLEILEQKG